jgi:F0F1-type ATP synthase delta subunit
MMQRYMFNTFNAVRHLAVTVRSDIYPEINNDFQKVKSSLKRCNASILRVFLKEKKTVNKVKEFLKEYYLSAVHLQITVRNSSMNNYIN